VEYVGRGDQDIRRSENQEIRVSEYQEIRKVKVLTEKLAEI